MNLSAWGRRQGWLQAVYRWLPGSWRARVASSIASSTRERLRFPNAESWPPVRPSVVAGADRSAGPRDPGLPSAGVNLFGYMRGQFGLAESARLYARALLDSGADVSIVDIDLGLPHGWEDRSLEPFIGDEAPHRISIIFVNPDYLDEAFAKIGRARLAGQHVIGCWFWELEDIPAEWIPHLDDVDEIMVASTFVERAFRKVTSKPVLLVPLPLGPLAPASLDRSHFGLPEHAFVFLCTFDFHSWLERKNPFAVLEAFKKAFPKDREDVFLLVKTSNGHQYGDTLLNLLSAVADDRRILIRDQIMDAGHLQDLQRCCDAYISLHRAEGFGLGLAECMALGKPVVATGWSGNMEFMTTDNSRLVDYTLVPVLEGQYPHVAGAMWAEADVGMAAVHMRELANDRGAAAQLGERGRQAVLSALAPQRAAERIMRRCAEILAVGMPPPLPGPTPRRNQ
ncbi:glycosyltransferase [Pseudoxanthomonas sp. F11]|uniref:glycosyltransferase n=1 Tax=Pseudoxanthomonas sp. F11 TaxID=3126308 RepID=UPI00300D9155